MGIDAQHRHVVKQAEKQAPSALVIGAGPAGLFAAEHLAKAGLAVTVVDQMPSVGRKFLMAGRGGLNLTHSEPLPEFLGRYGSEAEWMRARLETFPPSALVTWANELGIETFVGSSGRIFPVKMKASPLLRAWLQRLRALHVTIVPAMRWTGWDESGGAQFASTAPDGNAASTPLPTHPDVTVLALGGGSWPRLGSDGSWIDKLIQRGVACAPLAASNAGVICAWSPYLIEHCAGHPLKRIAASIGDFKVRGEAILTRTGLEGGIIYALGTKLRAGLATGPVTLTIDLRPDLARADLANRLSRPRGKQSLSNHLRKTAGLSPVQIAVLRERAPDLQVAAPNEMARAIKAVPVEVTAMAGLERAISTAGGIRLDQIDDNAMLTGVPGVFVAGEMLDWDAPTGGYLLQGCFATAHHAAQGALNWLRSRASSEP